MLGYAASAAIWYRLVNRLSSETKAPNARHALAIRARAVLTRTHRVCRPTGYRVARYRDGVRRVGGGGRQERRGGGEQPRSFAEADRKIRYSARYYSQVPTTTDVDARVTDAIESTATEGARPLRKFKLREVRDMCDGFSSKCPVLGEGSFGMVYRGTAELDGRAVDVAVKRLSAESQQGVDEWLVCAVRGLPSIRSRSLDEFQATFAGPSHAVASMAMDDFLRSVWLAEESQMLAAAHAAGGADPRARDKAAGLLRARSLRRQKSAAALPRALTARIK
ncbi:unnamed protein product [Closterium sp. NIES-54]